MHTQMRVDMNTCKHTYIHTYTDACRHTAREAKSALEIQSYDRGLLYLYVCVHVCVCVRVCAYL